MEKYLVTIEVVAPEKPAWRFRQEVADAVNNKLGFPEAEDYRAVEQVMVIRLSR